jgi:hypothetical protein
MKFGTSNLRSPYRPGSLKTVAKEIAQQKLDLVGVEEVGWNKGSIELADVYNFSMERRMQIIIHNWTPHTQGIQISSSADSV